MDSKRNPVSDNDGMPLLYQVVSVYKDRGKAGLVTSYGEHVGMYPIKDLSLVSTSPIFKKSDYKIGTTVVWIDNDDVYEGTIYALHDSLASVTDVKKLMPVNYSVRVPYWKIPDGRMTYEDSTSLDNYISIGNDPNKRRE